METIEAMTGFKLGAEQEEAKAARAQLEKATAAGIRTVNLRCAADITAKPIPWLWKYWLPAGKLTILAGDGGTGKTTLALGLAAVLTAWGKWPDDSECSQPGNVLIWSSEDNPDDTLVPRLIASGADMKRCHFIDGITENGERLPFDPAQDIPDLHRAVEGIGGVSLLIVDPIVSAVSGDMHKANDVRRSLQALVDFGEVHKCAVLGISHFGKGGAGKSPLDRVIGSQAFGALARMVLVTAKEENSSRRVLARAKSNIAPDDGGISYNVEVTNLPLGIETTHVIWEGIIEGTAREILGDVEQDEGEATEKTDLEQFIKDLLQDGPMYVSEIERDVRGAGYNMSTVRRMAKKIGVDMNKDLEFKGKWKWSLPILSKKAPIVSIVSTQNKVESMKSMDPDVKSIGSIGGPMEWRRNQEETEDTAQNKVDPSESSIASVVSLRPSALPSAKPTGKVDL